MSMALWNNFRFFLITKQKKLSVIGCMIILTPSFSLPFLHVTFVSDLDLPYTAVSRTGLVPDYVSRCAAILVF